MKQDNSTMKKAPDFIPDMEQPKGFKVTKLNDAEYMGERYGWSSNAKGWFKLSEHPEQAVKEESQDNSKEGFTKGKWVISKRKRTKNIHGVYGIDIDTDSEFQSIITVWADDENPNDLEAEANARLIAQAPDMYRFIKKLHDRLDQTQNRVGGSSSFGDTYHVMWGEKSIGETMKAIINKIDNK